MIGILDLNVGNVQSLFEIVKKINNKTIICKSPEKIKKLDKIIMPGQGAYGAFMKQLKKKDSKKNFC